MGGKVRAGLLRLGGWRLIVRYQLPPPLLPLQTLLEAGYDVLSTDRCAARSGSSAPRPCCTAPTAHSAPPSSPRRGWLRWQDPWGMGKADEAADLTSWARAVYEHEIDLWASLDATGGEPYALQLPSGRGAQRGE